jgi:hypothetical protein
MNRLLEIDSDCPEYSDDLHYLPYWVLALGRSDPALSCLKSGRRQTERGATGGRGQATAARRQKVDDSDGVGAAAATRKDRHEGGIRIDTRGRSSVSPDATQSTSLHALQRLRRICARRSLKLHRNSMRHERSAWQRLRESLCRR